MTIATTEHDGSLVLASDQTYWTPSQVAALRHIGIDKASDGDLTVFHHVCQRTGLDPFARQIYMIARQSSEKGPDGQWNKVLKWTIQTGIDGFRLIGRRAADHVRHSVSVGAPEWAHEDGSWRPVWAKAWGYPVAARVTIQRAGLPFTAVALFDEYKQTKYGGELTSMWEQRPAGQLAKCAEALGWRMAFPQDLSGIYTDDEMGQAENLDQQIVHIEQASAADRMGAILAPTVTAEQIPHTSDPDAPDVAVAAPVEAHTSGSESPLLNTSSSLAKAMYAAIKEHGVPEAERIAWLANVVGREIASSKEMTDAEARDVLAWIDANPSGPAS